VEIEKNSNSYDRVLKEISSLKSKISENYETFNSLSETLSLFEQGTNLDHLSDMDLSSTESLLLSRLETVKTLQLKRDLNFRLSQLSPSKKRQMPSHLLKDLESFSLTL
jgi:hypothetical protein